ncbi:hypothetical protein CTI12_AA265390 [Artemisia annua]|uniref:Uncharacterized protein n=1 Tax=Artemisia annua TaxID=35608 RepID=A0A2U1NHN8_ARTAN|nr:hypothetical protein CTI12_AA265390 [Artemisia annua]
MLLQPPVSPSSPLTLFVFTIRKDSHTLSWPNTRGCAQYNLRLVRTREQFRLKQSMTRYGRIYRVQTKHTTTVENSNYVPLSLLSESSNSPSLEASPIATETDAVAQIQTQLDSIASRASLQSP